MQCNLSVWNTLKQSKKENWDITDHIAFLYIVAIYLSIIFTTCGLNLLIQMITVNLHHVRPLRAVPKWIQLVNNCLSFRCDCFKCKALTDVTPENRQISDVQLYTVDPNTTKQADDNSAARTDAGLLDEIRVWRKKVKCDEEEAALSEEWKSVAHHLNRLFLFVCIATQIIIALLCFVVLPNAD